MDWIHSTRLGDLARIPDHAAALALVIWTSSGGAPHDAEAPRYPVTLGTVADVAKRLCVSERSARRALRTLRQWCIEVRPKAWTPRIDAWTELEDGRLDSLGRPLYVRIDPRAVARLISLSRGAHPRTAHAAFRVALALLPRLRGARHAGRPWVSFTNAQAERCGLSRATAPKVIKLLQAAELVELVPGWHRRISTRSGLLAEIPPNRSLSADSVDNLWKTSPQPATSKPPNRPHLNPSINIEEQDLREDQHSARERAGGGQNTSEMEIVEQLKAASWTDGSPVFPQLGTRGAKLIARHCKTLEDVDRWIEGEILNLTDAKTANPAGLLIYLAREEGSRPWRSSTSEKARRSRAGRGRAWTLYRRWYLGKTLHDERQEELATGEPLTVEPEIELTPRSPEIQARIDAAAREHTRALHASTYESDRGTRRMKNYTRTEAERATASTELAKILASLETT